MKTSIATVSIAGDFREKLSAIAAAGFDGIEIFEQDFIGFESSPSQVGAMVRDHGLDIMLFQPFRDFEGFPDGPHRDRAFARARQKFGVMNALGTDLMLICSSAHPAAVGGIDRCANDLAELGDLAEEFGVRVGYEALAWGRYVNDHRDAWEIVRRADHPRIGLILDSYHTLARRIDPDSIRSIPGDRIFFLQLADAPAIEMDLLYLSRHYRNMPGEGDLDLPAFMRAVEATGYEGPLSLEIFNDQFRRSNAHLVARDGHRALVNLSGRAHSRTGGQQRANAIPLPPAPDTGIIRKLDFQLPPSMMSSFASLLEVIGFERTDHADDHMSLSQAGVVLSLAHGHDLMTGPTLRGFDLVVNDVPRAIKRANALGAMSIPGAANRIQGLHGSAIGFQAVEEPRDGGEGEPMMPILSGLDHLSQTLAYDEMLSWSLFYTTIFAFAKSPIVDVVDPDGLVKSQVLSNSQAGADATTRIILNGSDGPQTMAGSFAEEGQNSAAQHIAFKTTDIMALARRLKDRGIATLGHSQNYYDDLEARFGLLPDTVESLQTHGLMYDEDDNGTFYQLYLPSFKNGFFFEFTQRTDGYAGLGAPNAPYRLAAQRRLARSIDQQQALT